MFSRFISFFALLTVAYAQQVCPDGNAPLGPCPCPPSHECNAIINQCCPAPPTLAPGNFTLPPLPPAPVIPVVTAAPTTVDPATACEDLVNPKTKKSDCPTLVALCDVQHYRALMTEQCPKTCKRCATPAPPTRCVDLVNPKTKVSDCPARKDLCKNKVYDEVMRVQCPKTCKLCTPTAVRPRMMMPKSRREPSDDIMERLASIFQDNKKQELPPIFGKAKVSIPDYSDDETY